MKVRVLFMVLAMVAAIPAVVPAQQAEPAQHVITPVADVVYEPIEVPGFDSGMSIAVVHGDPNAASGDYTLRLAFPDGYRFPSHWHPKAEHLTVLEGVLLLAMGATTGEDSTLTEYRPGAFLYLPAENQHYGGATGDTVIQLHGEAPFEINLSEAATE